jgi:hypothetical protein
MSEAVKDFFLTPLRITPASTNPPPMTGLFLVALLTAAQTAGGSVTITTLDGQTASGNLAAWSDEQLTVATPAGETVDWPIAKLMDLRLPLEVRGTADAIHIELTDGSRLVFSEFTMKAGQAAVRTSLSTQPLLIGRDAIRVVELRPSTPLMAAKLEEIDKKDQPGDALVVSQRDSEAMDHLNGVIGDVTAEQVSFKWDGERVPVKRTKVAALKFYQSRDAALPDVRCQLELADGSRVAAAHAALSGEVLHVITPAGIKLEVGLDRLVRADFSSGKIVYLSDLKPTDVSWTPGLGVPQSNAITARHLPRNDFSFSNGPLTLLWKDDVARSRRDIRTYSKGLAFRSRTELTYRLPEGMTRFLAIAGIDPQDAAQGNVLLTVRGDDSLLWEGVIDGRKPPVEIDVELSTARRLHLTVDYGGGLDYGDRLHLVEARVTK